MSMSQTHELEMGAAAATAEAMAARSTPVETGRGAIGQAEARTLPEHAEIVSEPPAPRVEPEAPALAGQDVPSNDEIEMSAQAWWQANVQTVFDGPGTRIEKAEALQQLGPSPDPAERIIVNRDGEIRSPLLELDNDAAGLNSTTGRAELGVQLIPGLGGAQRDYTSDQANQRHVMLKAAEQIRGQVAELQQQLDGTGIDQFGSRMQIGKQIQRLDNFADRIEMAASKQTMTVDLSREEIDYGSDLEAAFTDERAGIEQMPYMQRAERIYEADLEMIEPALTDLAQAGIEVTTEIRAVAPPHYENTLEQDEGLEIG